MAHGSSTCFRCKGLLVRDMYGVWYHDGSQEGIEKFNDDDHAPEPQQGDLIAIKRAEQQAIAMAERKRISEIIYDAIYDAIDSALAVREDTDAKDPITTAQLDWMDQHGRK